MKTSILLRTRVVILCCVVFLTPPALKQAVAKQPGVSFVEISNMEEDWSNMYRIGDYRYDFRDVAEGKSSLELLPDEVDGFAGVEHYMFPMNLSLHGIRFFMKSNDWDLLYSFVITFHTYGDWNDYFYLELVWKLSEKPNNEWIEVTLSPSEFTKVGNPTWQSINKVTFRADVNPGMGCQVKVDALSCFFNRQQPAVSIVFDDGQISTMIAKAVMDEYHIAGSLFVIPTYLSEPGFISQEMVDLLHDGGWDIGGHGDTVLTELTEDKLHDEFLSTKTYLESHHYKGSNIYALPYGVYNQRVLEIGKQYFSWIRPNDTLNQPSGYIPSYRMNSRSITSRTTANEVKEWIDRAKEHGDWVILVFHRIDNKLVYDTDYLESAFREIIQYTLDSGVPIMPMSAYLKNYSSQ